MSEATNEPPFQPRLRVLAFWVLFFSFIAYVLLTVLLVYQRGGTVQLTPIFADALTDIMAIALVVFYLTVDLGLTWHFYRRALGTSPDKGYVYALASVVTGVLAPYIYGLLVSFMGIMRDIFPILYTGLLYGLGVVIGLRIIPTLVAHVRPEELS